MSLGLSMLEIFCSPSLPTMSYKVLNLVFGNHPAGCLQLGQGTARTFARFPYVVGQSSKRKQHSHGG